jgi:hypothetical protein
MNTEGKSIPTTIILGAGATRGAISHVLVNQKRIKAPLNFDFFKVAETYARASGAASADSKRLDRLKTIFKTELPAKWPPPMETAFSLLYTAKDFPEIYASRSGPKPDPGERRELEDFLSLLFDILFALDRNCKSVTGYDRLAGVLESGDTIITLNYDTMMDSALLRRGWDPQSGYALGGGIGKLKWKPTGGVITPTAKGVKLLKLHGSVNWWVRGTSAKLSNVFSMKPVAVTPPRTNSQAGKIRQVIPPIYGKVFGHSHWRKLWKSAFDALCWAELLVVIGCSIVDTDYHLQALLRRAAKERKKHGDRFNKVILVDRVHIRRRWQKVLKGAAARFTGYRSFEAFLKKGVRV